MDREEIFLMIDKELNNWLPKYGLTVAKMYKDEIVRVISINDNSGNSYQMWLEPYSKNMIEVFVYDLPNGKNGEVWSEKTEFKNLQETLDKSYMVVDNWIKCSGNERSWY